MTRFLTYDRLDKSAGLAQSVERIHGKDEVAGSIPATSIQKKGERHMNTVVMIFVSVKQISLLSDSGQ